MKTFNELISKKIEKKSDPEIEEKEEISEGKKSFIVVTKDFSGFGWAKKFKDEGNDVILTYRLEEDDDKTEEASRVGSEMFKVIDFDELFKNRSSHKKSLWVFDMNIFTDEAEKLRSEGYMVFGGQTLSEKMEHDRKFASETMEQYGLESPPTHEFASIAEGLAFLEENEEKAFVFKPDNSDGSYSTFVPDSEKDTAANEELRTYMRSLGEGSGSYILQERIKGVETNFEVWFFNGKPFFGFCGIECKRKLNHDYGEMVGCAQDINFILPLKTKGIRETVGKLFPFYEKQKYTGFADVNVIISKNKPYFLEVCNRFGYNSHPNLFLNLAKDPVSDILWDFANGKIDGFYDRFNFGFGASIVLYADHIKGGAPMYISEEVENQFFCFDGYCEDDHMFLSGYSNEIGIVTGHGYTIKEAAETALKNADKINFPMRGLRSDIDKNDYPSSPQGRYDALLAMKYLEE